MISLAIQRRAIGRAEKRTRNTRPSETTKGPDRHTIARTGGIWRSAETRSPQPLQKLSFFMARSIGFANDANSRRQKTEHVFYLHVECHCDVRTNFWA